MEERKKKEEEEEEEEEGESEEDEEIATVSEEVSIETNINFEIPAVLHNICLFLSLRDLFVVRGVSKMFQKVSTEDYLMKFVTSHEKWSSYSLGRINLYTQLGLEGVTKEDIFPQLVRKMNELYLRRNRFRLRREELHNTITKKTKYGFIVSVIFSIICPPLGFFLQGLVAWYFQTNHSGGRVFDNEEWLKLHNISSERSVRVFMRHLSSLDAFCGMFCSVYGLPTMFYLLQFIISCCNCCCVCCIPCCFLYFPVGVFCCFMNCLHAPNYAFIHCILWLGRFIYYQDFYKNIDWEGERRRNYGWSIYETSPNVCTCWPVVTIWNRLYYFGIPIDYCICFDNCSYT